MTTFVTIESTVNPAKLNALNPFLEENLPNVRGFDGCLSVNILLNAADNSFLIFEEWKSPEHHKAYIEFISSNGVLEQLASHFSAPPKISYFQRQAL